MASLTDSLASFIASIFHAILALFQHLLNAVFGVIQSLFAAVGTAISGLAQTFQALFKFLLSTSPTYLPESLYGVA
jgi:phage-related protein